MAAVTGATATIARPGRRKVGALVRQAPEGSSCTYPIGALLARVAGSGIVMGSTALLQSTGLIGLALSSGQNLTANGLKNATFFQFEKGGMPIKLTMAGTWTGTAHRGVAMGLSMATNGSVVVAGSGGNSTCGSVVDAVDWDNGIAVADGDVNPVVYFVVADAAIAY